jgi:hypothetical protein
MADLISIVENMIEASKYKSFPDLPMHCLEETEKSGPGKNMVTQTVRTGKHRRTIEAAQYSIAVVNYPVHCFPHSPTNFRLERRYAPW